MSAAEVDKCARCKGVVPNVVNILGTQFWGLLTTRETVTRSVRLLATYIRDNPRYGSPVLRTDKSSPMCDACWGLLVGSFLQGRSVPALPGKESL